MEKRVWEDTPKRGETYGGWFFSLSENGHVQTIKGGYATEGEAHRAAHDASGFDVDAHNPDVNKAWKPLVAWRIYACAECGHEITTQTNHTGNCYPDCAGKCRQIFNPHTAREKVARKSTTHRYIREAY